jgi:hypothetical protein
MQKTSPTVLRYLGALYGEGALSGCSDVESPRWKGFVLIPTAAVVLCGGVFLNSPTKAQPRQDNDRPEKEASVVSKPVIGLQSKTQVTRSPDTKLPISPAPVELKVASGQGRAGVYALDAVGKRIPEVPGDPKATLDIRWAVVTGVVDHGAIQESFSDGDNLAVPSAERIYRRVDLERQSLERGSWSGWHAVDTDLNYRILDNLPDKVLERTDDEFRVDNLVDPVPVLVEGIWKGLDVERLVPHLRDGKLVDPLVEMRPAKKLDRARPPVLMMRAFDFGVEPGKTYRYRARLVFWTPEEIRRKMKRTPSVFHGPWSEPTDAVKVE